MLGTDGGGGTRNIVLEDYILGQWDWCPFNGTVSNITVFIECQTAEHLVKCALYEYTDYSSSYAGNLIAETEEKTIAVSGSGNYVWYDFNFSSPIHLTYNTNYYMCVWGNKTDGTIRVKTYYTVGYNQAFDKSVVYGVWEDPLTAEVVRTSYLYNMYMVLDVDPPNVTIVNPVNWSSCGNTNNTDFNIQFWGARNSTDPINVIVLLSLWDGLTYNYVDSWYNETIAPPFDAWADGEWYNDTFNDLCMNRTYIWNAIVTDYDGNSVFSGDYYFITGCDNMSLLIMGYNSTSEAWDNPVETNSLDVILYPDAPSADYMAFSDTGASYTNIAYSSPYNWSLPCNGNGVYTVYARYQDDCGYYYCNDTIIVNGSLPNITLFYPNEGDTYTTADWGEMHNMELYGETDTSTTFDINVTSEDFYTYIVDDIPVDYTTDDTYMLIDLSEYVWFDDQNYTITLTINNCFGNQTIIVNFTIGDPLTDLDKHISLKALSPERENYSQMELLEQGVTFDIICTEPNGIDYTYLMTDWDGFILDEEPDNTYLDEQFGWQTKKYYSGRFYSRSFYKTWLGIYNGTVDVQWDDLYGYESIQYKSFTDIPLFHYIFNNSEILNETAVSRYQLVIGDYMENTSVLYDSYTGIQWGYGTYLIGDIIPLHSIGNTLYDRRDIYDSDWVNKYEDAIPGIGLLMAIAIITLFSLLPVLITHAYPPLIIQVFFTEMGIVISYAMGVFPLWVFTLALIGMFLAVFYKIFQWYKNMTGVGGFSDLPVAKQLKTGYRNIMSGKTAEQVDKDITAVKKWRAERQLRFPSKVSQDRRLK